MQHTIVVLPGAWGNKTEEIVRWWFQFVIAFFEALGWKIVVVTYRGRTLGQIVENALSQVARAEVSDGAFAIGYSMGAQIARGMCEKRPGLFRKVALIGGLERGGVRFWPFLKGLWIALWPFLRALVTGNMMFTSWKQVWRIMYSSQHGSGEAAREMMTHMASEPVRVILQLAFPVLRRGMQPLPAKALALVGDEDFFAASATYEGDREVAIRRVPGASHAFIRDPGAMAQLLLEIQAWFLQ